MFTFRVIPQDPITRWLVTNTELPMDHGGDVYGAHEAQQWAIVLGQALSIQEAGEPVTFGRDRACVRLLQQCPEPLRRDVVTLSSEHSGVPVLVLAHVLGIYQTAGFIQSMFDDEHEYEAVLAREWVPRASALHLAATTRRWRMLMELASMRCWRSSAVAAVILAIPRDRHELYRDQEGFHYGVDSALSRCLHESIDARKPAEDRPCAGSMLAECVTASMVEGAQSQLAIDYPTPSYACHVRVMVRLTIETLKTKCMGVVEPLEKYVPHIDMPTRMLLLMHALRTDDGEDVSRIMIQLQLFPSVDLCLDTNIVPGCLFPDDCPQRCETGSLLQLCGAYHRENSNEPLRALFGEDILRTNCVRPKLSQRAPFTRREAYERLGPWKLPIMNQLIAVRSIHGVAWALDIPAATPDDDEAAKDAIIRGLLDIDVVYNPLTLEEAVSVPSLALRLAAWGLNPFVGHDGQMSAFEHAVREALDPERLYFEGAVTPRVTLAQRLARAYAEHCGKDMERLLRDRHVRASFSRAMSFALASCKNDEKGSAAVVKSIAPLSNWRVWIRIPRAHPAAWPQLVAAAFDPDTLGIVQRAIPRLVPTISDTEYDDTAVVSIMYDGDNGTDATESVFTTATERGRERARHITRWGGVPYQHGRATRAQVVACLVVLSVPAKRWHLRLRP